MTAPTVSADDIAGRLGVVVLAGGLARRMGGVDKGLVEVAGKPMVQWTVDALRPFAASLVINANRNIEQYSRFAAPVITDQHGGHLGPLAGLAAGIQALPTELVMMCPCDSPFIQAALLQRLAKACSEPSVDVAIAHDGERAQPVFCVVHRRVQSSLLSFLDAGERKIDRWTATQQQQHVACNDLTMCFTNINTEAERLAAEQQLTADMERLS